MKKKILITLIVAVTTTAKYSISENSESWKYFNQTPPGKTAQLFAPELIKHLAHCSPTFSPSGNEMFWSTVSVNEGTRKIFYVQFKNGEWSKPHIAPFSGNYHDDQPFISYDGKTLLFASKRPQSLDEESLLGIWNISITKNGWSEPRPLFGFWTPSITKSGTLYFLDIKSGYKGNCGIYRSELKDGKYTTPEFLQEKINQKKSQDWCPFISSDESYLIFSSDREGGFGSGDLYICFRGEKGEWKEPINMGESVNTSKQERFPGVSPDGKYLFFTRYLGPPNLHDLFWIDAGIINVIKKSMLNVNRYEED